MMTLDALLTAYCDQHLRQRASYAYARRLVRQCFQGWDHPTRDELRQWHLSKSPTPIHANKALILIGSAYNWATRQGYWHDGNPAKGIARYPSPQRERVLSHAELCRLRDGLAMLPPKYRAYFSVLLYTGCRMSEARVMQWADLEPDGRWTKRLTKNGRAHVGYLPTAARLPVQALEPSSDYVFPGLYGRPLSRAGAEKAWGEYRALLGLQDVWLHDLRRTLATYLYTELHVDELGVKAVLGHYDRRPIAHYVRLNYDFLARTLRRYEDWILALRQDVSAPHLNQEHRHAPLTLAR